MNSENKTILVVDDSDSIRTILRITLQFKGFTVLEAADGCEAFETLNNHSCDLVITDIAMPNMSGIELLSKIRTQKNTKTLPVIICTAETNPDEIEYKEKGATRLLRKPVSPVHLMEIVESLLLEE